MVITGPLRVWNCHGLFVRYDYLVQVCKSVPFIQYHCAKARSADKDGALTPCVDGERGPTLRALGPARNVRCILTSHGVPVIVNDYSGGTHVKVMACVQGN